MPLVPLDRLDTLATSVMDAVVAKFGTAGVSLPDRRYVHVGQVARECSQLTVGVVGFPPGAPGRDELRSAHLDCNTSRLLIDVELLRCVPTLTGSGGSPTSSALDASAEDLLIDGWVLVHGLALAVKDGSLEACSPVVIVSAVPVGPEGAYGGWQVRLDVGIS